MAENKLIKSYCSNCQNSNNHKIIFKEHYKEPESDYDYSIDYMLIQCMGCETYSFRKDLIDNEQAYPAGEKWEPLIITSIYPSCLENHNKLDDEDCLPENIRIIYKESVDALIADCFILAGVGFRAVIEAICIDKVIKGRSLKPKINNLSKEGLITRKECERLHSVRFLGNDSIHEMKVPQKEQLIAVLNIIEHLLKNLYLIDLELEQTLDTPIYDYKKFKQLLNKKLRACKIGDEYPLIKYIGKDVRRIKDDFIEFEKQLKEEIINRTYDKLEMGNFKPYSGGSNNVQYYIVK